MRIFTAEFLGSGLWSRGPGGMASREVRDFVIEAQRRFDRRTLHNHVSGLRTFYRYWQRKGRLARNPFVGAALPKLGKRLGTRHRRQWPTCTH